MMKEPTIWMSVQSKTFRLRPNIKARCRCGGSSNGAKCAKRRSGGHLELVSEFEVMGDGEVHPHHHPTFEFYYVITGRAS
jgi:mannose-6-phosphate isomerase-like protein (cupin superfamily)